ncbi:putative holin-like toxin [Vagococcus fessus]|uniref:Putative holin-like toxin n=1 Tax=Vagococcus fessus TaxID=120370 RepID=A0A430A9C8_9ENTE|nr:putative holin-like toxin [Vagococcus fessus]
MVLMKVSIKIYERRGLLSVASCLQLMLAFGSFVLLLVTTIVGLIKKDEKK